MIVDILPTHSPESRLQITLRLSNSNALTLRVHSVHDVRRWTWSLDTQDNTIHKSDY